MATIRKEIEIETAAECTWDALRDVGNLHTRLVRGFVTECRLDGDARIVTFTNGLVAREVIVSVDEADLRLVWSATGERLSHHNAAAQVFAAGKSRCRLVWTTDLRPDAMAPAIEAMMQAGVAAMKQTLEANVQPEPLPHS